MELFIKRLTPTDIDKRLAIPTNSLVYFPGFRGNHSVDLKVKDKSHRLWTFRCSIRKKRYLKPVFSSGWLEFVRSNNLRIGDKVSVRLEQGHVSGVEYGIEVQRKIRLLGKDVWADVL
ncbi:AP2/ERF and B3 domain-containing transcription factor RAV1-like [Herrania umbratica]|uniref:AP2/ERF and B3 domain-containing transcription factor RAV1-like n=1 Tax=Herrania umbratica TaxID=108875 RepID=A0A6J1AHJ9_9ROSI|nr:AP2/ERF and B3 domain-containing transcription factor RAV1-like [Herrania umbratica]